MRRVRLLLLGLLIFIAPAAVALAAGTTARAATGSHPAALRAPARLPSAPASAAFIATALQRATGLTPAQVAEKPICAAPSADRAGCDALALANSSTGALVHPAVTSMSASGQAAPAPYTPQFLQAAYDLSALSATAGTSDTIGIVDAYNDPTAASDMAKFRSTYGLPACTEASGCFRQVSQTGSTSNLPAGNSDWEGEETLDLDAVSAICPNCKIILAEANSAYNSDLQPAAAEAVALGAQQISESFGYVTNAAQSESGWVFPGVQVFSSTGDDGYPGAGKSQYPAAFPGVIAVSGTSLTATSGSYSNRGYAESAWSLRPGYGFATGSGCDLLEAKPAFQTDTGCTGRAYGDISADADPYTGLETYDSGNGGWGLSGGTSLASPLSAAFAALTDTGSVSQDATWAYADANLLNDPASGSNGVCATAITYICDAGVGYDGPTGIGSIEGDIVSGTPGVGGTWTTSGTNATQVNAGSVSLQAGIYPNGLPTTYYWQYGASSSYGQATPVQSLSASQLPQATMTTVALAPGGTYHFQLVAQNGDGTQYGPDQTIVTPSGNPPVNAQAPTVSGAPGVGSTLTANTGTWTPTPTSTSYQWQHYTAANGWQAISGATGSTYAVQANDLGDPIDVLVTETGSDASQSSAQSLATAPAALIPASQTPPVLTGTGAVGQMLSVTPGSWSPSGTVSYQWERNTGSGWSVIAGAVSSTYQLVQADVGAQVDVLVSETTAGGTGSALTRSIAVPALATVTSPTSASSGASQGSTPTPVGSTPAPKGSTDASAPKILAAPRLVVRGRLRAGATIRVLSGRSIDGTASVQIYRCDVVCKPAARVGVTRLKLTRADAGDYFTALFIVRGANTSVGARARHAVGPVGGPLVAVGIVPARHGVLRDEAGQALISVKRRGASRADTLVVRAVPGMTATVRLCATAVNSNVVCTAPVTVRGTSRQLGLHAPAGTRVQVVAVGETPARRRAPLSRR